MCPNIAYRFSIVVQINGIVVSRKSEQHLDLLSIPQLKGKKCQNVQVVSKAENTNPLHGILSGFPNADNIGSTV